MSPGANFDARSPVTIARIIRGKRGATMTRDITDLIVPGTSYTDSGGGRSTKLNLNLRNTHGELLRDEDIARKGTVIGFAYGYPGLVIDAGQFVIDDHSGRGRGGALMVICKERIRGKMARKKMSRRWDSTVRSIPVREVLLNHFPASAIHIDDTKMEVATITQQGEHDWQFVTRQAQLAQREYYLDEKGAHWEIPRRGQRPSRLLRYVDSPIGVGEIIDYSFNGLGAGIPGRVVLKGKDFYTKKPFIEIVDKNTVEELTELTITAGADDPDEGDRLDRGDTGREIVRNTGARTAAEAREIGNALYKEAKYGALKMRLELVGDPTLRSRRVVMVWGIGPAIDGLWWAKTVTNNWSGGYRQSADLTREGLADKLKLKGKKKKLTFEGEMKEIATGVAGAAHAMARGLL